MNTRRGSSRVGFDTLGKFVGSSKGSGGRRLGVREAGKLSAHIVGSEKKW